MERDTRYLEHFDPHAPELRTEFWDALDMMRRECPVAHSDQHGGFWVVTRYPDVARVLQDPETFRSGDGVTVPRNPGAVPLPPIESDPPEQREWRRILNPYFTPAVIKSHADAIRDIANEIIDEFIERGEVDLQMGFAHHFPGTVFFREVLGIDGDDLLDVLALTHTISFDNASEAAAVAFQELGAFCAKVLQQRAVEQPREHDVIRALIDGTIGGEPIPLDRQAATLMMIVIGGLDTSSMLIGNIVLHLCNDPALADRLRGDPPGVVDAIEEFLRLYPSVTGLARHAAQDVELGGQLIRQGEPVLVYFAGACRDPEEFDRPHDFMVDRATNRHLAFGLGAHRCIGSNLARLEVAIAIQEILRRMTNLRVKPGTTIEYTGGFGRGGPRSLPITFTAIDTAPAGISQS